MATRKVKDAQDKSSGELIYFRGHAAATYLSDGRTVEDAILGNGSSGSGDYATKEELSAKQDVIPIADHGTSDTTFELTPNVFHRWGEVASLTLTLATPSDTSKLNYYMVEFVSGSTATTLSLPNTITWSSDVNIEAGKTYQISILDNCGVIGGF